MIRRIRTLVVDDSAFVRKVVREILSASPFIEVVGMARNGEEALAQVAELNPDVVTCDLSMPKQDGLNFVRAQMARRPLPILILTADARDSGKAVDALSAGAVDIVLKPTALATDDLRQIGQVLVDKVRAAATAPTANLIDLPAPTPPPVAAPASPRSGTTELVVMGLSTGGPQALRQVLSQIPASFPVPIAIVLHMPPGYTASYAERLDLECAIEVREAREGDLLLPGVALLGPAGRHITVKKRADGALEVRLTLQPIDKIHRPAADVLFRSAAEQCRVLAVVMTGMGDDGREGCAWVKAQGGRVLTEAESSCVIYGMPRAVMESGLSDAAVPLSRMALAIFEHL